MIEAEQQAAAQIRELTEDIEEEKERRREEREEKKRQRELQRRRETREKWVGPILLAVTALISFLLIILN